MSKTKKIISLLLTVVLVMTMATVAIVSSSALEEGEFHVVAGAAELCGSAWDPADTANQMDWNADKGIYEKIYTNVAAGTYEFKVTTNGGWDNGDFNLVGDAMYGGANAVANVEADGSTVIIGFDGFKALLEITAGSDEPIVTNPTDAPVVTDPVVTDAPVVDGETITIYFENNWMWPEVSIYYWGGASGENATWPGAAMTEIVGKNGDGTYDIYKMEVPADITGIVFSGEGGYGRDQSADVTDIQDGLVYYMTWDEATQTKPCGSYEYAPVDTEPVETEPVETEPVETEPVETEPVETEPVETEPVETEPADDKGVKVNDDVYAVSVGDEITYVVYLTAEELFEDVQATITYDADKLELAETKSTTACPGLASGLVFNAKNAGVVKFNAVYLDGYNFTEEGIFVTLTFNVKDNALSEIDLLIEEMTILTGESYFTDGEPSKTEGITVREVLEVPQQPTTEPIETEPVETEPVETEPVETEPVETEPVDTKPVDTKPVDTEPSATTPDATSATGTNATEAPNAPGTGATAYIYVALAILAMAAAAVVVLRKKANG